VELSAGRVLLRELPGPPGAPTVVLLHGWTASADLNFCTAYAALGDHFRVLAFDHRGHGAGIRTRRRFRLEDCADDVAELLEAVDAGPVVALGYSMGGAVAQLLWRRHRDAVRGLVLAATAARFKARYNDRLSFLGLRSLGRLARLTPAQARAWLTHQLYLERKTATWEPWAIEQVASHDWRMVLEAGGALGSFCSTDWLHEVDVPTSVVVTMQDAVVPLRHQIQLFESIPGARAFRVDAGHDAIVARPHRTVPLLVEACHAALGTAPARRDVGDAPMSTAGTSRP
jgi:3-oxoadipate enol-lactonase